MPTKTDSAERFWPKVEKTEGCWLWRGARSGTGYGWFFLRKVAGRKVGIAAHRQAYELAVGPVPDGLVLDHLCRVPACVNPDHLEPVEQSENVRRGLSPMAVNSRKVCCVNGHEFTPENTYLRPDNGTRQCKTCIRARAAAKPKSPRGAAADRTHCPRGHEYTEANTYVRRGTGHRACRTCHRERVAASKKRSAA